MAWRRFLRRGWWDDERARELESYLEIEMEENIARGMPPDEARAEARRKLGDPRRIRREIYEMNSMTGLEWLWHDVRYASRVLLRNPGFALAAMMTLAIGIGSVTAIYSVLRSVVLDPFPYAASDRLVDVFVKDIESGRWRNGGALGEDELLDYVEQADVFEEVVATISTAPMLMPAPEGAIRVHVAEVTPNTFSFLGVTPALGRGLGTTDETPSSSDAVVLSHDAWMRLFGGDLTVVGRTVTLADRARTIVGVMPPRVAWHNADVWIPRVLRRGTTGPTNRELWLQARLKPGVTTRQAETQLDVIAKQRAARRPDDYPASFRMEVITVIDFVVGRFRQALYTLLAAVGLLLLIACCNVTNMLLARATTRERELTLRTALGAGRLRLASLLLTEAALLSAGGATVGAALAWLGVKGLAAILPRQNVAWEVALRLDGAALLVALGTMVATTVLVGLLPAWHGARRDLAAGLKESGKGTGASATGGWLRSALVVAQVGLSLVLVVGAGALMRNFVAMIRADAGFDTSRIAVARPLFPPDEVTSPARLRTYVTQALDALRAVPGVTEVAASAAFPLGGLRSTATRPGDALGQGHVVLVTPSDEQFLPLLDRPARLGRLLTAADLADASPVAVANRAFVTRLFGTESPLGQFVRVRTRPEPAPAQVVAIVGVVDDIRNDGLRRPPAPALYLPSSLHAATTAPWLVVRVSTTPDALLPAIERALRAVDRSVAVPTVFSLDAELREAAAQPRFSLVILTAFAGAALLLVAVGVYGVVSYGVARRWQEFAVRMAVGASQRDVVRVVVSSGARLLALGIASGLAISWYTTSLLDRVMPYFATTDPWAGLASIVVIAVVGLAACVVPARRAARISPMDALRQD